MAMELDLRDQTNGHTSTNGDTPKKTRAELAGATPIPSTNPTDDNDDSSSKCGYFGCHPSICQVFTSAKWFLAFMSVFVLLQSLMVSGYLSSVITTIEKRYDLRSTESGLIVSSFDFGSLLVVVFISYFGGKGHRPRWVGIGATIVAAGAILFATPQFIAAPYELPGSVNASSPHEYLCSKDGPGNETEVTPPCEAKEPSSFYIFLFVISNMIIGIGSTPIYTLGTTYLYDNAPRDDSSLYIAIMYLMGAIGPALGYVVGGAMITFYIDPWMPGVPSDDPRFIGAWWAGYVLCGILILISAIPLLGYPRRMRRPVQENTDIASNGIQTPGTPVTTVTLEEEYEQQDSQESNRDDVTAMDASMNFGKNIKDLPRAFASLLSNPIFLCITASATLEFSIIAAFLTFIPKYLQDQFGIDPSQASIFTGVVLVPSAGGGIMMGGYIIKRLRLNMTGCAKVALISNVVSIIMFMSVFLVNCPVQTILGITEGTCNDCLCDLTSYEPICLSGDTYYNPCKAGCTAVMHSNESNTSAIEYLNCGGCNTTTSLVATPGVCKRDCTRYFIPFMVCLFFVTMATASAQTPGLMVTLRCVKNDERPFAMGLQFVFFRALAYIPSPIYFGSAIDRACIIWRGSGCQDGSGSCQVYDADLFRYIYFGLAVSLKFLAGIFVFFTWILCRRSYTRHDHTTKYRKERQKKRHKEQKEEDARRGGDTYGSLYGRSQVNNRGDASRNGEFSSSANNNNHDSRSAVTTAKLTPLQTSTLPAMSSSSESESSMNSAGSQRPLIKAHDSRTKLRVPKHSNNLEIAVIQDSDMNMDEINANDVAL